MNTVEQNRKDFVAFVRKQLTSVGIKHEPRTSKKHLDGDYGMFVEPNGMCMVRELCVVDSWMSGDQVLSHSRSHEYVHFLQWFGDDPLYRASRDDARDYYEFEAITEEIRSWNCSRNGISFPNPGWGRVRESSRKYLCSVFVRGAGVRVSRKFPATQGYKKCEKNLKKAPQPLAGVS